MKKIMFVLAIFTLMVLPIFSFCLTAHAQSDADNMLWGNYETNVQAATGLGNTDPRQMAAQVVNIMLGFLGIIAVVIILLGGFKWMTAAGDEAKVDEAKKLIGAGVIGLVVILAAFGVAQFVINALYGATGATG
ncbi:hypothetical protein A2303_06790 [Candidatus Falkowbacteria bacterium RIFOXYB2_FULL_47_14]|uniref:DUF4134 domain-containing protein n=1 Tax=Candidatus Falkowbacteria bacterium RIFOXYA2_FULL_47_19 TaxID=1797994 RepID=A0A1F5SG95_9BACT|nr:MAG: hypothetical protein A2227_00535 [Candidatus Falkowbacteria bacterium RIFOXYA2_FULL_47_19]OGF35514.1 MAG: hypothetical protein A2468_05735 [Candidatus Falkowbacteria bacterium RIFOXYC2_FULL_46_15]OGF43576.1 MAG: hypothetical protein A2303_06790 [Candidatus Falkowbacteria bacterium RIFOXYB2_FULL_47_14]